MPENRARQWGIYAVALIAVLLVGGRWLARDQSAAPPAASAAPIRVQDATGGRLVVHVAGAVR